MYLNNHSFEFPVERFQLITNPSTSDADWILLKILLRVFLTGAFQSVTLIHDWE